MDCAACGTQNPAGARFCMNCGNALERRCPSCGTPAPPEARFCMNCGSALDAAAAPAAPAPAAPPAAAIPPEERRQVTVLFADLSGYTAFAEGMDPEDVKSLVDVDGQDMTLVDEKLLAELGRLYREGGWVP